MTRRTNGWVAAATRTLKGSIWGMTRRTKMWAVAAVALILLVAGTVSLYVDRFNLLYRLDGALQQVQYDGRTLQVDGKGMTDRKVIFACSSFDQPLNNADLAAVFDSATATLKAKFHQDPQYVIKTDDEGWDQLCAMWDLRDGHAEVCTGSGNDSNYTAIMVGPPDGSKKVRPGSRAALRGIYIR
jgi:hypothetical protein